MKRGQVVEEAPSEEAHLGLGDFDALGGERGADLVALAIAHETLEADANDDVVSEGGAGREDAAQVGRAARGIGAAAGPADAYLQADPHAAMRDRDAATHARLLARGWGRRRRHTSRRAPACRS